MAVPVIELAAGRMWPGARGRARRRAADVAREVGFPTSGTVDPIRAGSLLHALHDVLVEEAGAASQALSPFAWLWYLRRLPASVFAGEWATTEPYDLMLAETLSAASLRPEPPLPTTPGVVAFDLDDTALRPVFELCGWAAAISAVQSTIRRAGKGMSVSLGEEGLPWSVDDGVVGTAIELYDRRVEQDRGALVAGTESLDRLAEESETLPLLCAQRLPAWQDVPGWEGRIVDRRGLLRLHGRWLVDILTVDRLVQMLSGTGGEAQRWWDPGLLALVLLLRAMHLDAVHNSEVVGLTLPRVGYVLLPEARIRSVLDACLERGYAEDLRGLFGDALPASGAEVLAAAARVPVSAFPLSPGPLVRPVHGRVLVDVGAASQRTAADGDGAEPDWRDTAERPRRALRAGGARCRRRHLVAAGGRRAALGRADSAAGRALDHRPGRGRGSRPDAAAPVVQEHPVLRGAGRGRARRGPQRPHARRTGMPAVGRGRYGADRPPNRRQLRRERLRARRRCGDRAARRVHRRRRCPRGRTRGPSRTAEGQQRWRAAAVAGRWQQWLIAPLRREGLGHPVPREVCLPRHAQRR
jgi:hypothetical protein